MPHYIDALDRGILSSYRSVSGDWVIARSDIGYYVFGMNTEPTATLSSCYGKSGLPDPNSCHHVDDDSTAGVVDLP